MTINGSSNIIMTSKTTTDATGEHFNGNCLPVTILEDGKTFTSIIDAANYLGVTAGALWQHLHGRTRSCCGKHAFFVRDRDEHYNNMTQYINEQSTRQAELEYKAAQWDAYLAEQERIHKAEEKRINDINKARERLARRQAVYDNAMNKVSVAYSRLVEAREQLEALENS